MSRSRRNRIGLALLAVWMPVTTVVIATMMVDHIAPLPPLGDPDTLTRGVRERFEVVPRAIHVIAGGCSCTEGLIAHLVERGASDRGETVLFVGEPPRGGEALAARGFAVDRMGRSELRERLAIDGAPVLIVPDGEGGIAYAGGYFDSPAAVRALDQQILAEVDGGRPPTRLPLFGCAVDPKLADERDPIGLRRRLESLDRQLEAWLAR